jgi:hypothetical protein
MLGQVSRPRTSHLHTGPLNSLSSPGERRTTVREAVSGPVRSPTPSRTGRSSPSFMGGPALHLVGRTPTTADGTVGSMRSDLRSCEEQTLTSVPMYVGLSVAQAEQLAVERDEFVRTVEEDGKSFVVTMERRRGRVNLVVVAGKIIQACRE